MKKVLTRILNHKKMEENEFEAIITSYDIDRHNTRVNPDGLDIEAFQRNPVLLYQHEMGELPIGQVTQIYRNSDHIKARFVVDGVTEFERILIKKLNKGSVNGVSIGFSPDPEHIRRGEEGETIFDKAELIELSVVSVQSNKNTVITSRSIIEDHIKQRGQKMLTEDDKKELQTLKRQITELCDKFSVESRQEPPTEEVEDPAARQLITSILARLGSIEARLDNMEDREKEKYKKELDDPKEDDKMEERDICTKNLNSEEDEIDEILQELEQRQSVSFLDTIEDIDLEDLEF